MGMLTQRSLEVPIPGDVQTSVVKGPEQPNLTIKLSLLLEVDRIKWFQGGPSNVHYSMMLLHCSSVVQKASCKFQIN